MAWVRQFLAEKIAQGEMSPAGRDAALARITPARTVEAACREADLVLEALPEDIELKIEIFALLDRLGKPGAIFASASSSFAVADMTAMTVCADRCVGMRFAGAEMKRLEIVRGPQTSEQTMEACREVGRRMQMEVTVLDEPVSAGN
jgi:3-hydroxybutyryl-CoA dehydrogenase